MGGARTEIFGTSLKRIGQLDHFRCGALYRTVWDVRRGELFKDAPLVYPRRKFGDLIRPVKPKILKKGELEKSYVKVDLEDIEDRRGQISRQRSVDSLGSDKIIFGDADILFSKLRPYLGKTILNDKSKPLIGTTELVPLKVSDIATPEYVKYLLLTEDFLDLSQRLMYGKQHPRIDVEDLLNLQVPCPPIDVQRKISDRIQVEVETKVSILKGRRLSIQEQIDESFATYKVGQVRRQEQLTVYKSRLSQASDQKYLRCGARYRYFWDVLKGRLFEGSAYPFTELRNLVDVFPCEHLRKGELDERYVLVDLPDVIPIEGRIKPELHWVDEVESDKVIFGLADVLFSHIDPYLGHVILNNRDLPLVGTTEFIPLKAKEGVDPRFVRYLLLSKEFLAYSKYVMYGKRHPRVHLWDLRHIRVPNPPSEVQRDLCNGLEMVENANVEIERQIDSLYSKVETLLNDGLRN
jgi:restriction endonuclease S subunit